RLPTFQTEVRTSIAYAECVVDKKKASSPLRRRQTPSAVKIPGFYVKERCVPDPIGKIAVYQGMERQSILSRHQRQSWDSKSAIVPAIRQVRNFCSNEFRFQ